MNSIIIKTPYIKGAKYIDKFIILMPKIDLTREKYRLSSFSFIKRKVIRALTSKTYFSWTVLELRRQLQTEKQLSL